MQREVGIPGSLPARFADLKQVIAPDEESRARMTAAWSDILAELKEVVHEIKSQGSLVCIFSYANTAESIDQKIVFPRLSRKSISPICRTCLPNKLNKSRGAVQFW